MRLFRWIIFSFLFSANGFAGGEVSCGVADGFPPFQFKGEGPAGIDYEILKMVVVEAGKTLQVQVTKWDDIVALLRLGQIDCAAGMEVNEARKKIFDFTQTIYLRRHAVFVLEENNRFKSIDDLVEHRIAGDRQSFVEQRFEEKKLLHKMRVFQPATKMQSMELLRKKEVDAVIAPLEVGTYLAGKMGMKVKVLGAPDIGSPVAIAVKKGDKKLLDALNRSLGKILRRDGFRKIFEKWHQGEP